MKMNIVKQVDISTTIDSKDMGVAFAVATQEEQVDFIVAVVKEFNSWGGLDKDTQMARICINNRRISLGVYDDINDAIEARKQAEEKYFGEWSYDNSQKRTRERIDQ